MRSILAGIILLPIFLLITSVQAEPYKLLILDSQSGDPYDDAREAMLAELQDQGYVQGKNLTVRRYSVENRVGLGLRLLQVETDNGFDVIFTNGTIANKAAFQFGYQKAPLKFVFCSITDPVGVGLIDDFGVHPAANFTGVAYGVQVEERLRFLNKALPAARRIGMIYADMPQSQSYVSWLKAALQKPEFSHLEVEFREVPFVLGDKGHIRMAQLVAGHVKELDDLVDVYMTPSDQLGTKKEFAHAVTRLSDKPLMGLTEREVKEWGAHFALYPQHIKSGQRAGQMLARIFSGEEIGQILPEHPVSDWAINQSQSRQIGLNFPDSLQQSR